MASASVTKKVVEAQMQVTPRSITSFACSSLPPVPGWNHRRTDGAQAFVEQKAGRHEMIGPGVEHAIAGAEAGGGKGGAEATAVAIVPEVGFVDGARRDEDADDFFILCCK